MIIAIGGFAGSGKSSIAKKLAEKLGYDHYSIGDLQRELATEHGMTIKEWGEYEKKHPEFDNALDDKQKKMGEERDDFVIDAWLGAYFIPNALKIFLTGDEKVRAERINNALRETEEKDVSIEERLKIMLERQEANRQRWMDFYGFDWTNTDNYDFILDTTELNQEQVFDKVYEFVKSKLTNN